MPDQAKRQARIDAGLCASCGVHHRAPGRLSCEVCLEVQRLADARRREKLAAAGICLDCRRAEAISGQRRCAACAAAQRARMRPQT